MFDYNPTLGYQLDAVVGRERIASAFAARYPSACLVELAQGFVLVPLTQRLIREISPDAPWDRHQLVYQSDPRLPQALSIALAELSMLGQVAYLEASYFGGEGLQAAVVWEGGRIVLGPIVEQEGERNRWPDGAINDALQQLGVESDLRNQTSRRQRAVIPKLRRLGLPLRLPGKDEFDTVGLGLVRKTEDWPGRGCGR